MNIQTPLTKEQILELKAGDTLTLTGFVYTARDAAHKKLVDLLDQGKTLPFDLDGQIIYYVGPTPARPGQVIGSAGPTTSGRMDAYAPRLLERGLAGMIGKGEMGANVALALQNNTGVYLAAIGGAAALIAESIKSSELIAYKELGPEAIRKLWVENFPLIVAQDCHGGNVFEQGRERWRKDER